MLRRLTTIITIVSICTASLSGTVRGSGSFTDNPEKAAKNLSRTSCPTCPSATKLDRTLSTLNRLETLGQSGKALLLPSAMRSVFDGEIVNLVSTATGQMAFSVTDLEISGSIPIMFQRIYASDSKAHSGLGTGWSFIFDDRITIDGKVATLTTGGGSNINFRREGQHFVLKTAEPISHQSFDLTDKDTISEQAEGLKRTYKKHGAAYRLTEIADANNNKVSLNFDARKHYSNSQ